MRLPGRTGLQVSREVKESKPYIKSIVITAYPSVDLAVEAMKLGAADYLIKPVAPDNLEKLIRETLLKGKGGLGGRGPDFVLRGHRTQRSYSIYYNGCCFPFETLCLECLGFYIILCLIIRLSTNPDFIAGGAAANA